MTLLTTSNALSPGALETIWSRWISRCIFDTINLSDSPADNIEIDQRSIACMVARTFESGRCDITVVVSLANPPSPSFHTSWETRSLMEGLRTHAADPWNSKYPPIMSKPIAVHLVRSVCSGIAVFWELFLKAVCHLKLVCILSVSDSLWKLSYNGYHIYYSCSWLRFNWCWLSATLDTLVADFVTLICGNFR